eukprot:COSAG02_NODE_800_length_17049_cov_14.510737_12_plen_980_part_00
MGLRMMGLRPAVALAVALCAAGGLQQAEAVDKHKFRTCAMTGFCRRHRGKTPEHNYWVAPTTVSGTDGTEALHAHLEGGPVPLALEVTFLGSGIARARITEPKYPRWEVPDIIEPLAQTPHRTLQPGDPKAPAGTPAAGSGIAIAYGAESTNSVLVITYKPFKLEQYINGELAISANSRSLFHFEHRHHKGEAVAPAAATATTEDDTKSTKKIVDYDEHGRAIYEDGTTSADEVPAEAVETAPPPPGDEDCDGCWEENFQSHVDTKPLGPSSVGMDLNFHGAAYVYGIPEHATQMALKPTGGSRTGDWAEPYRLYTLDVFEYELDVPMALYGDIPLMIGHDAKKTVGAFWHNPSELFVDVGESGGSQIDTHWISESGIVDLMLLSGPTALDLFEQWGTLTGTTALPPLFSIAYHQCRWNYNDEADALAVHGKFEELDFPYDVLWLDIEHTDGKRYFTWDKHNFPEPKKMIDTIAATGRKMVTIVDPHIKIDSGYHVHKEASAKGYYIKNKDGNDFDGWCWPGSSSYLDYTTEKVRDWWASQFDYDKYVGSTDALYTWNDMNEPSVFNGPEVSMQKDCKNLDGVEHREWHNLYGMYQHRATAEGLIKRNADQNDRPFVLSRSFYAGSQKWGAIWTGDNKADWSHLAISTPMLLTIGMTGLPFSGADVGGFFGNPDSELLIRWYQAGSLQPFFRAHAHHDAKRREPWVMGEPTLTHLRRAVLQRYQLLPFYYTLYHTASLVAYPVIRPLWAHYPADTETFALDDQFLAGEDLLVKPVTAPGTTSVSVYFPGGKAQQWYDVSTTQPTDGGQRVTVPTPLEKIPVYQRGGSIIPKKMRVRRSSSAQANDPYTLVIALDTPKAAAGGSASGDLYLDDGHSFDHQTKGAFSRRRFEWSGNTLTSKEAPAPYGNPNIAAGALTLADSVTVERILVWGWGSKPTKVTITEAGKEPRELAFAYSEETGVLGLRKPDAHILSDFTLTVV